MFPTYLCRRCQHAVVGVSARVGWSISAQPQEDLKLVEILRERLQILPKYFSDDPLTAVICSFLLTAHLRHQQYFVFN